MEKKNVRKFTQSVKGKVIISSIIACGALYLAWETSKIAFNQILKTVENISEPTDRLRLVNSISLKFASLEQTQKSQSLNKKVNYNLLIEESKSLNLMIDSLKSLYEEDSLQLTRVESMRSLIKERDDLYFNYLKDRKSLLANESIKKQFKDINKLVKESTKSKTINIKEVEVEEEPQKNVESIEDIFIEKEIESASKEKKEKGFFNKIFGKKKSEEKPEKIEQPKVLETPKEDISVKQDIKAFRDLAASVKQIEENQQLNSQKFLDNEALLIYSGDVLMSRTLSILKQVEIEALKEINQRNAQARVVVNKGIKQILYIILIFIIITVVLLYFILDDISKNNKYREELEIAKENAEYHAKAKQRFLSSMSHEIRTPLQSIIGYADIIRKQEKPNKKDVDAIFHSSEHLIQIVNEILDYNRIVSGRLTFTSVVFDIKKLLEEVISVMKLQAIKKNIKLYYDEDLEDITLIEGDAFRLKQVLYNLLSNAIKFTKQGHVSLNVSAEKQHENLFFTFIVEDTGIGMSKEDASKVFNEFEQVENIEKQVLNRDGAGLGLAITKSIIEEQGGNIVLESELGSGSTFTVNINFKDAKGEEITFNQKVENIEANFNGKVWILDDDTFILDLCASILSNHNINYTSFNSPLELLNTKWDNDVKLVFTDIRMPEMSGIELCKALKKTIPKDVKVIAITAQVLPEEKENILANGFDDVLTKPFRENDIIALINNNATTGSVVKQKLFENLEQMTFGDKEQLHKILKQFIIDCEKDTSLLSVSIENKDVSNALLMAHRLAGRTAQIGAESLSEKLRTLEYELIETEKLTKNYDLVLEDILADLQDVISKTKKYMV